MAKKKIVLTFPSDLVGEPITYRLVKDYDLILNILRAQIDDKAGTIVIDLEGEAESIEKGIKYVEQRGVDVQEAIRDIMLDEETCVDCGACMGVCRPEALVLDLDDWRINFDKDKCVFCELCIDACPTRSISVKF